jgi:Cu+-exporting ATPase
MTTRHEGVRSGAQDEHTSHAFIDPVCGMSVEPAHAAGTHMYHGETYYFCSQSCLDRFAVAPEQYTQAQATHVAPQRTPLRPRVTPPSTPARCTPKSGKPDPAPARSAAWRLSP